MNFTVLKRTEVNGRAVLEGWAFSFRKLVHEESARVPVGWRNGRTFVGDFAPGYHFFRSRSIWKMDIESSNLR